MQGAHHIRQVVEDAQEKNNIELPKVFVGELVHVHSMVFNLDRIEHLHDGVTVVFFSSIVDGDHLRPSSS
jgi:hypothetical protein